MPNMLNGFHVPAAVSSLLMLATMLIIGGVTSFAPPLACSARSSLPTAPPTMRQSRLQYTQLSMGLFDWNNVGQRQQGDSSNNKQPNKKKYEFGEGKTWTRDGNNKRVYRGVSKTDEAKKKENTYQGAKITIRQDEDSAMWIDDSHDNKNQHNSNTKTPKGWFN